MILNLNAGVSSIFFFLFLVWSGDCLCVRCYDFGWSLFWYIGCFTGKAPSNKFQLCIGCLSMNVPSSPIAGAWSGIAPAFDNPLVV